MALTDIAIRALKPAEKPRKVSDGGGLFLLVQPTGGKLWRLAYRFAGKQKLLSFGPYPHISLKDARSRRDEAKELLAKGTDPGEVRKAEKAAERAIVENTFGALAREWFDTNEEGWTDSYSKRLWRRIEGDLLPKLGERPIDKIEPPELLAVIRVVEARDAKVLAKRLLQVSGQIFRFAVVTGRATRDPSGDLRGALKPTSVQRHHAALRGDELPAYFSALRGYDGNPRTVLALRLVAHTAVRSAEARFATWNELNLDGAEPLWRIPAERMKMRSPHIVPLTPQVIEILKELKKLSGASKYVLPSGGKEGVISQNTLIYALYRLGYHSRATVHGFRGTFSTVLNENGFNRDWIERQLAHTDRDGVRSAYNSAEWLSDRRGMMAWWSDYLDAAEKKASS